ncbi:hypothetical protein FUAX_15320 [Fulvitalea axinellae]|uniref:Right handed beta helix region n=1 Tax=Fulvitalea axinellae TaxID=1182444 RepID=A0AAU9DDX6_9BACT|nr:hypothetical protein FUAX_15320 [Fulvitalea axinellae]
MKKIIYFLCAGLFLAFAGCGDSDNEGEVLEEKFLEVATDIAADVTEHSATLNAKIISEGKTEIQKAGFYYWVQGNLGSRKEVEATYDKTTKTITAKVSGLNSYTEYAFTVYAEDSEIKEEGDILNLKTTVAPGVTLPSVQNKGITYKDYGKATLTGMILSDGKSSQTTFSFYVWERGTVGKEKSTAAVVEGDNASGTVKGLSPGVEYAFTMVGLNELGASVSDTLYFTTNTQAYVDIDASGNGDGSSWEDAFTSINTAISKVDPGVQLWIAEGLYKEFNIPMKKGYDLYGGFKGTESTLEERDPMTHLTMVGGEEGVESPLARIFVSQYGHKLEQSIIDGLVIQYGDVKNYNASAFYCTQGSPQVRNCVFRHNKGNWAAAIWIQNGATRFDNCIFENNMGYNGGGVGVTFSGSDGTVFNECIFRNNEAINTGRGGVLLSTKGPNPIFRNCIWVDNKAKEGPSHYSENGSGCPEFLGDGNVIEQKDTFVKGKGHGACPI